MDRNSDAAFPRGPRTAEENAAFKVLSMDIDIARSTMSSFPLGSMRLTGLALA
jgi:hypothetical protein